MKNPRAPLVQGVDFWQRRMATLTDPHPELRPHLLGVSERCRELAQRLGMSRSEIDMATTAGLLHDIGKVHRLARTGWHPLDGGLYLRRAGEPRLAALVAHHTGALYEAMLLGHDRVLEAYPRERSLVADVLAVCDITTRQDGRVVTMEQRLEDIHDRYSTQAIPSKALHVFWPELEEAQARIDERLAERAR